MIYKGLNDEEAVFLQLVADKQAKLDAQKRDEETQELLAYRVGKGLHSFSIVSHPPHILLHLWLGCC